MIKKYVACFKLLVVIFENFYILWLGIKICCLVLESLINSFGYSTFLFTFLISVSNSSFLTKIFPLFSHLNNTTVITLIIQAWKFTTWFYVQRMSSASRRGYLWNLGMVAKRHIGVLTSAIKLREIVLRSC